eukprot:2352036-Amphidinium_carterae.4
MPHSKGPPFRQAPSSSMGHVVVQGFQLYSCAGWEANFENMPHSKGLPYPFTLAQYGASRLYEGDQVVPARV